MRDKALPIKYADDPRNEMQALFGPREAYLYKKKFMDALFYLQDKENWTRGLWAKNSNGYACPPNSLSAVCWCAEGMLYRVYNSLASSPTKREAIIADNFLQETSWKLYHVGTALVNDSEGGYEKILLLYQEVIRDLHQRALPYLREEEKLKKAISYLRNAYHLIEDKESWTRKTLARNEEGYPVDPAHFAAVRWCAVGSLAHELMIYHDDMMRFHTDSPSEMGNRFIYWWSPRREYTDRLLLREEKERLDLMYFLVDEVNKTSLVRTGGNIIQENDDTMGSHPIVLHLFKETISRLEGMIL